MMVSKHEEAKAHGWYNLKLKTNEGNTKTIVTLKVQGGRWTQKRGTTYYLPFENLSDPTLIHAVFSITN